MICDRCKQDFDGDKIPGVATFGYYEVGPAGTPWGQFANPGEVVVCDQCMRSDPRFIAIYGDNGSPESFKEPSS